MSRPLRVLTFTTLYPNAEQPRHGIFIEHRLRQLLRHAEGEVEARVVAPVPWFPFASTYGGRYATFARVPPSETRHGIRIEHPRYRVIPKIGMTAAPALLAAGARGTLRRLQSEGFDFDVIDAHFLYPDGVAAVGMGQELGKPVLLTARGSDVHTYRHMPLVWRRTLDAAARASHVVTVSEALRRPLLDGGLSSDKVTTLRNGVDLELFRPVPREQAREDLNLRCPTLLSVGNLVPVKGHDLVVQALAELRDVELVIVGEGPERDGLHAAAAQVGVADRMRILPVMSQPELCRWYTAADALVLASSHEGWPNVLLEAMACGTPVVAAGVWGVPEIVRSSSAGILLEERSPRGIAVACARLLRERAEPAIVREYAAGFDWHQTSRRLSGLIRAAARSTGSASERKLLRSQP